MRIEQSLLVLKRALLSTMFLLSVFLVGADAQTSTVGSISGTVRDAEGAVIPKVEVVVQDDRTGLSRSVLANDDGFYSVPSLPFGRYSVSTAPQGFKKTIHSGIELHVNENVVVNMTLEVGLMNEEVTVYRDGATVDTRSSSVISEKQVTELPIIARNYMQFALMVPGVSPGEGFDARGTGLGSLVDMSVNGNASNQNLWTIDGVNNVDVGSNQSLLVFPSIDAIQEFRVERNSFSAEFGQAQGAVINLITKGGSNQFHGTVFEFFRNDALNATDFILGRGVIRGPGITNFDFSVAKNWRLHDQYYIQFRAEMFNAFNHPNFSFVNTYLGFDNVAGSENFEKPLNPNFGTLNGTRGAREAQFGLKFRF